jgi:hypothetical protein
MSTALAVSIGIRTKCKRPCCVWGGRGLACPSRKRAIHWSEPEYGTIVYYVPFATLLCPCFCLGARCPGGCLCRFPPSFPSPPESTNGRVVLAVEGGENWRQTKRGTRPDAAGSKNKLSEFQKCRHNHPKCRHNHPRRRHSVPRCRHSHPKCLHNNPKHRHNHPKCRHNHPKHRHNHPKCLTTIQNIDTILQNVDTIIQNVDTIIQNVYTIIQNVDTIIQNVEFMWTW